MEIGNEISQKIRSAIKAKLVELGAYVDDELPDYIMVMVANKKSKAHMTEDLNLFLGNNTDRFTTWLHGLLQKLKSITVEQTKPETSESGDKNEESPGKVKDDAKAAEEKTLDSHQEVPRKLTEREKREKRKQEEEEEVAKALEAIDDEGLTLEPETDEFAEEENLVAPSKQTKAPVKPPPAKTKPKTVTPQAKEAVLKALPDPNKSKAPSRSTSHEAKKESSSVTREVRETTDRASRSSTRKSSRSGGDRSGGESEDARGKRRAPGSVVGSVIRRREEEEDVGYDPHKPQYGRVASTVKIGTRRPTLPPSKQANKSLLLKAVSEAKTSVEKATKSSSAAEAWRRPEAKSGNVHSRLGGSVSDARSRLGPNRSSARRRSSPEKSSSSRSSKMRSDEIEEKRPKREDAKERDSGETAAKRARRDSAASDDKTAESPVSEERTVEREDDRLFESKSDAGSEEGTADGDSRTVKKEESQEDDGVELELLIQSGAEDSDFTDEETPQVAPGTTTEDNKRIVQEPTLETREKAPSPKFVVSLDGIDPDMMEKFEDRMDEDLEGEYEIGIEGIRREEPMETGHPGQKGRNIVKVRPMQLMGQTDVEAKRGKLPEKCKFWPSCRTGTECPYFHPTTPCRAFPNCSFGNKCNYIHPNCIFDASCTRANCPYTHTVKKKAPAASPPIILQPINMMPVPSAPMFPPRPPAPQTNPSGKPTCKFFPKCTNMSCPYYHPKMCRFGLSCRNRLKGCTFTHPALPTKDQLKWTATSRPGQPADESLDSVVIQQAELRNQSDEEDESVSINL